MSFKGQVTEQTTVKWSILSAGLRFHLHLSGGLRLRNYRAVAKNHKFSSRFLRVFVAVIQTELRGSED